MKVTAIKTRAMRPPQDNLYEVLEESLPRIEERTVVVVTSKVVAIHQGRCIPLSSGVERDELVPKEAELFVRRDIVPGEHIFFTMKHGVMIASAGMDKSNADNHLVLWPREPMEAAKEIGEFIKKRDGIKQVGVVVTDSHVVMRRRGTQGVAIGWWGFGPIRDYRGKPDIFGRLLVVQTANLVDSLAAAAVVVMGEGKERTPLAIIEEVGDLKWSEEPRVIAGEPLVAVPMEEDLFLPMLQGVKWEKGEGGLSETELERLKTT